METAFVVEAFPIPFQTLVFHQITGLIAQRHDVDIYADLQSETQKIHPDFEAHKLLKYNC
jgi:hypothetical protein